MAIPLRLFHFYQPFLFVLIYLIFNAVYILAGGLNDKGEPVIYPVFEWKTTPRAATIAAVATLGCLLALWLVFYALYWIRRALVCCCPWCDVTKSPRGQVSPQEGKVQVHEMVQPKVIASTYM